MLPFCSRLVVLSLDYYIAQVSAIKTTGVPMSAKKKILLVDDDDMLRGTLMEQLSLHDEFQVSDAATATIGIKALKQDAADLVILDVNLPDMDGREACKIMRRNGYKGPVIMLTGQGSDSDMILGLDSGANDYVVKAVPVCCVAGPHPLAIAPA